MEMKDAQEKKQEEQEEKEEKMEQEEKRDPECDSVLTKDEEKGFPGKPTCYACSRKFVYGVCRATFCDCSPILFGFFAGYVNSSCNRTWCCSTFFGSK